MVINRKTTFQDNISRMNKVYLPFIMLLIFISCQSEQKGFDYFNGVEVLLTRNPMTVPNIMNNNNQVYLADESYCHEVSLNGKFYTMLELNCLDGFGRMIHMVDSNYCQSIIEYRSYRSDGSYEGSSFTGMVDNPINLWLHPPRNSSFITLQMCPFPYVKYPLGREEPWTFELDVGAQWLTHYDCKVPKVTNKCQYTFVSDPSRPKGQYVIQSSCTSSCGNTSAEFVFEKEKGFVVWLYKDLLGQEWAFKRVE